MSEEYKGLATQGSYTDEDLDCAVDCLIEAKEIQENKELMKLVEAHAKKRESQISSIQDLREASYKVNEEKMSSKKGDTEPGFQEVSVTA